MHNLNQVNEIKSFSFGEENASNDQLMSAASGLDAIKSINLELMNNTRAFIGAPDFYKKSKTIGRY
jgi:hypothetical protein